MLFRFEQLELCSSCVPLTTTVEFTCITDMIPEVFFTSHLASAQAADAAQEMRQIFSPSTSQEAQFVFATAHTSSGRQGSSKGVVVVQCVFLQAALNAALILHFLSFALVQFAASAAANQQSKAKGHF